MIISLWAPLTLDVDAPLNPNTHTYIHPTLPSLYLRQSSFSNPSIASPTSQLILQPFFCFSYITGSSLTTPGKLPMHGSSIWFWRVRQKCKWNDRSKNEILSRQRELPNIHFVNHGCLALTQVKYININQYKFERVSSFIYLGSLINDTNDINEEIKRRIQNANKSIFWIIEAF